MNCDKTNPFPRRKFFAAFFAGALWGGIVVFVFLVLYLRYALIREYPCRAGSPDSARIIADSARAAGWQAKKPACVLPKCSDSSPVVQISLCNLKYAQSLVDDPDSKKTSAIIPCTLAVYTKADGKTYLSRLDTRLLGIILGGSAGRIFASKIAPEQEEIIRNAVE